MDHSFLRRAALASFCLATSAAGGPAWAASESVLYSFKGPPSDGSVPAGGLIYSGAVLYGTTQYGGAGAACNGTNSGCGTAFSVALDGTEVLLHSFGLTASDGSHPNPGLIERSGSFYGTTYDGGTGVCNEPSFGCGTVFALTPPNAVSVVYSFHGNTTKGNRSIPDGEFPNGGLIQKGPALYGTSQYGGAPTTCGGYGCGTIFKLNHSGKVKLSYQFDRYLSGGTPEAGLVKIGKVFYGTTTYGGQYGNGTVYQVMEDGTEKILYSFTGGADGYSPTNLVALGNELYGITPYGGDNLQGTLYKVSTDGVFQLVYTFPATFFNPTSLAVAHGAVYGTAEGGAFSDGVIFKIDKQGGVKTVYNFTSGGDGVSPNSLIYVGGVFYGTTQNGGASNLGTVFEFTP